MLHVINILDLIQQQVVISPVDEIHRGVSKSLLNLRNNNTCGSKTEKKTLNLYLKNIFFYKLSLYI